MYFLFLLPRNLIVLVRKLLLLMNHNIHQAEIPIIPSFLTGLTSQPHFASNFPDPPTANPHSISRSNSSSSSAQPIATFNLPTDTHTVKKRAKSRIYKLTVFIAARSQILSTKLYNMHFGRLP